MRRYIWIQSERWEWAVGLWIHHPACFSQALLPLLEMHRKVKSCHFSEVYKRESRDISFSWVFLGGAVSMSTYTPFFFHWQIMRYLHRAPGCSKPLVSFPHRQPEEGVCKRLTSYSSVFAHRKFEDMFWLSWHRQSARPKCLPLLEDFRQRLEG